MGLQLNGAIRSEKSFALNEAGLKSANSAAFAAGSHTSTFMNKEALAARYRVTEGKGFRLGDFDPGDTWKLKSRDHAQQWLEEGVARLSELQGRLYAENQWALLLIFQAMDTAGKDGTIKHVLSGVNPQGCQVYSFKAPSDEDLDHDFLWRTAKCLPERGRIGIFNRSYYEEVLVVRVHPELLARQQLPPTLTSGDIWKDRYESINSHELHLARNGIMVLKFFLYLSKAEQRRRLLSRLEETDKNWKFSTADIRERKYWNEYIDAYERMVRHTARPHAPWHIVPADHKWFTRLVVAETVVQALESLKLKYPDVDPEQRRELAKVRRALEKNKHG